LKILDATTGANCLIPGWFEAVVAFYAAIRLISEPSFREVGPILNDLYVACRDWGNNGGPVFDDANPTKVALERLVHPLMKFLEGTAKLLSTLRADPSVNTFLSLTIDNPPQAFR